MKNSKEYYDSIATSYSEQSKRRLAYLNAIDDYIVGKISNLSNSNYLDIGSGDGRRAIKIAQSIPEVQLTLVDDSTGMLHQVEDDSVTVHNLSFFDYKTTKKFDVITCLWNVIGHFPDKDFRLQFFKSVEHVLADKGRLFFDVNNRYNINHYGTKNVMKSLVKDRNNDSENGWFTLGEADEQTKVYIHNPFDIEEYLKDTSLKIIDTLYVNYESGKVEDTFFEGQLFYILGKK